jgi:hypothetical protein
VELYNSLEKTLARLRIPVIKHLKGSMGIAVANPRETLKEVIEIP